MEKEEKLLEDFCLKYEFSIPLSSKPIGISKLFLFAIDKERLKEYVEFFYNFQLGHF